MYLKKLTFVFFRGTLDSKALLEDQSASTTVMTSTTAPQNGSFFFYIFPLFSSIFFFLSCTLFSFWFVYFFDFLSFVFFFRVFDCLSYFPLIFISVSICVLYWYHFSIFSPILFLMFGYIFIVGLFLYQCANSQIVCTRFVAFTFGPASSAPTTKAHPAPTLEQACCR